MKTLELTKEHEIRLLVLFTGRELELLYDPDRPKLSKVLGVFEYAYNNQLSIIEIIEYLESKGVELSTDEEILISSNSKMTNPLIKIFLHVAFNPEVDTNTLLDYLDKKNIVFPSEDYETANAFITRQTNKINTMRNDPFDKLRTEIAFDTIVGKRDN